MLNVIRRLFAGAPRAREIADLEAELRSPTDPSIRGDVEFEAYDDGRYELSFELTHPSGLEGDLEVLLNGAPVLTLAAGAGHTRLRRTERDGPIDAAPALGDQVEVRVAGQPLASGVFRHD